MSKHRLQILAIVLGLVGLALAVVPAAATHAWANYHWARTANPFNLKLGDNLTSTWDSYLATTSSDWSASSVLNTTIVAGAAKPRNCRPTTGRVEVCNATYGNTGWLGVAGISITGGEHITQAYVKLNDTYFNTATYDTPAWRNLVTCQEVGHTFGLAHQDENFNNAPLGTCMDYSNDPNPNQHPNQHDYDQLVTIYSHLDSTNTVLKVANAESMAPPAMSEINFDGPRQWGRLVARTRDGGLEVYELDFGGGNKIVHYVLWTLEARRPTADPDSPVGN